MTAPTGSAQERMENGGGGVSTNGGEAHPSENGKAVRALQRSFGEVQAILEHNRVLIQEIGQNHEAGEADGLSRNVSLIRELNSNIARVVSLYSDLSSSFSRSLDAAEKKRPRLPSQ